METLNSRERRRSSQGSKLTKDLIGTPFNFNHVQGVYRDSPEQFIPQPGVPFYVCNPQRLDIEGVHDLHSLEILQNNLLRANRHKENSNSLAQLTAHAHAHQNNRSLQEDGEGSGDSGESELELMMSEDFHEPSSNAPKPRKPLRRKVLQGPHQRRRQSASLTTAATRPEPSTGAASIDRDCNRPSSPDLELRDPAFFDSLLSDNGSPRSEPCFSFIFDPPYSPPPPSFWSLPNSAFSRGGKRQGSTDSYTTSSTPHSDSPSDCVYNYAECGSATLSSRDTRASSLSLSSSTTRHSSEDEELLLASSGIIDAGHHRPSHGHLTGAVHTTNAAMMSRAAHAAPSMGARSATTMGLSGHRGTPAASAGTTAFGNSLGLTTSAQMPHFAKCTPRITKV